MKRITPVASPLAFITIIIFSVLLLAVPVSADEEKAAINGEAAVFIDLNNDNPNFPYIKYLNQRGVIAGYPDGNFRPEENLSRAQAAVMLVKAAGLATAPVNEKVFQDVDTKHWAAPYIAACVKAGFIRGYPDGTYKPEENLSRAQGISLVLRLSKQDMNRASLPPMEDVDQGHWAAPYIATGLAAEMVGLDSDGVRFLPDISFTRQEMSRALGLLLIQDPDIYASELIGELVVESGEITLERNGEKRKAEQSEPVFKGDIIASGTGAAAVINYSDGSSILMQENCLISISDSQGRSYITKDGDPGTAVDWLNFKIDKGMVFTALASTGETEEPVLEESGGNANAPPNPLLAAGDSLHYIAAAEKSAPPWYKTAEQKKVKVKVDMPYGVAAVRGTFLMINIGSDGQSNVSCLSGNAELSSPGGNVNLNGGQSSGITQPGAPPPPPAPMTPQQQLQAQQAQQWVQQTQQQMQQQLPAPIAPPPPAGTPAGQQAQQQAQLQQQQPQPRPQPPQPPQPQPPTTPGTTPSTGGGSNAGGSDSGSSPRIKSIDGITAHILQG